MNLIDRLSHFEKYQLSEGDRYGAEVLRHAQEEINQLRAKLAEIKRIANERTIEGSEAMKNLAKIREIVNGKDNN